MIAEHLPRIIDCKRKQDILFYMKQLPVPLFLLFRNLEEYYDNDLLHSIKAIVNGSTNFILTKMFEENLNFKQALLLAQQLGFAESDPSLDVEGYDAVNKWAFLLNHAYGIVEHPDNIVFNGIQNIQLSDATVAKRKKL